MPLRIEPARPRDTAVLHALIRALSEYERLTHLVVGTEAQLREELFGARPVVETAAAGAANELSRGRRVRLWCG